MGYRSVAVSYANFDVALNFDMNSGEILTLQSFYTLAEISRPVGTRWQRTSCRLPISH